MFIGVPKEIATKIRYTKKFTEGDLYKIYGGMGKELKESEGHVRSQYRSPAKEKEGKWKRGRKIIDYPSLLRKFDKVHRVSLSPSHTLKEICLFQK